MYRSIETSGGWYPKLQVNRYIHMNGMMMRKKLGGSLTNLLINYMNMNMYTYNGDV